MSVQTLPVRVAITGAGGRMGCQLLSEIKKSENVILGGALENRHSHLIGSIISSESNIKITSEINEIKNDFDVLIDFSNPESTMFYLDFCLKNKKKMIIGTTGFNNEQISSIKSVSENISIVLSANFSIGVNVMLRLLEQTAKIMGKQCDIEIIEIHHRKKIDAPSGTALTMGKTIADTLNLNLNDCAIYGRNGQETTIRKNNTIGFSSIRAGDIVGEHTVIFANDGERIEITHKASSRSTFANGAIKAAIWISDKDNGLFDMSKVLNLYKK
ncbi:4-hydroxy-tetrahydrodipicolinate reductase [Candidatus Schneideria nysicola]|uniref:4-hydroxy-tetrahydrodipicolinate reductase n=2 Tax=Candidatus Schneideria nysicola TaxID=1081631 RepID=UPI001CAA57C6|nr:4-hydroxy-tetrahydrodipicolinate reductase [Candidatus Schneideria nysicola]UAJ65146.1 4-hydroxy-tetrahydrodipicolinate reductase [Candidatus Schneideria nysicola]